MSQPNRIRHSLCALEGDISIIDVVIERNQNEEYLIPSLLALKHKVERLFGVQPSVSLSESRVSKTEDLCENEAMKRQFRLYAESVLESRKKSDRNDRSDRRATAEKEIDIDLGSEIEEVNESLLAGDPLISGSELNGAERKLESNGSELERLPFSNAEEWKPGKPSGETGNQSESSQNAKELERKRNSGDAKEVKTVDSVDKREPKNEKKLKKQSFDYKQLLPPTTEKWKPLFSEGEILYRRFHYSLPAPARDGIVLKELMKSYHLPCCHYDDLTTMKEFDATDVLNELLEDKNELQRQQIKQRTGNRIEFWKDVLGSAPTPRYRRFVYAVKPPILSKPSPPPLPTENAELQPSLNTSTLLNSSVTQLSQNETPPVVFGPKPPIIAKFATDESGIAV